MTDFASGSQMPGTTGVPDTATGTDATATAQDLAYKGLDFLPVWVLVLIVAAVVVMMIVLARRRRR
ncbi:hypothetical protein ACQPZG_01130 (plasmid) [Streptomyces sp. CA-294286]|uniref:hypothetical protein n=1 Tax=Streptomyces sp. CA-294286 TaxID=3240070 RepID=UPI003D8EDA67